mgnify:CR=1 FL=1
MSGEGEHLVGGLILIALGVILLLSNLYDFSFWALLSTYWPVIFIIIGGSILIKHWRS